MKNRKTIKRETISGSFTTVSYSILRDKNLTSTEKILLIEILSDGDDFQLSPSLYAKRMGVTRKNISELIISLCGKGYIKRTAADKDKAVIGKKKRNSSKITYFYTISEYGNLKSKEETIPTKQDIPNEVLPESNIKLPTKEQIDNFIKWIETLNSTKKEYLGQISNENTINDYNEMRRVGKLVNNYVEPTYDITTVINSLDLIGTIDEKDAFKLTMKSDIIGMKNSDIPNYIKHKAVRYNQKINSRKTSNLNQEYQN